MSEEIKRDSELGRKIHSIACKITDTIFEVGGLNDIKGNLKLLYPGIASLIINGIKEAFVLCKRPTETTEGKEIEEIRRMAWDYSKDAIMLDKKNPDSTILKDDVYIKEGWEYAEAFYEFAKEKVNKEKK